MYRFKKLLPFLLIVGFLFVPHAFAAPGARCSGPTADCCEENQATIQGGGCTNGQVFIGTEGFGYCQDPVVCNVGQEFQCSTNTCYTPPAAAVCSSSNVNTGSGIPCCAEGQIVVRGASNNWVCSDAAAGFWSTTASGIGYGGGNAAISNGSLMIDDNSASYDVWIQGNTSSTSGGDDRNLAMLGYEEASGDYLRINYNGEYGGGTQIDAFAAIGTTPSSSTALVAGDYDGNYSWGVTGYGSVVGGNFQNRGTPGAYVEHSGYALLAYYDKGAFLTGNEMGALIEDRDGSGSAEIGVGDYGIRSYGNTAGGYFKDDNGVGAAYLGMGDFGVYTNSKSYFWGPVGIGIQDPIAKLDVVGSGPSEITIITNGDIAADGVFAGAVMTNNAIALNSTVQVVPDWPEGVNGVSLFDVNGAELTSIDFQHPWGTTVGSIELFNMNTSGTGWYGFADRRDTGIRFAVSNNGTMTPVMAITKDSVVQILGSLQIWPGGCSGCDLAERLSVDPSEPIESGDVLVVSNALETQLTKTSEPYSRMVAGVYSSTPGLYMGDPDGFRLGGEQDFTVKGPLDHNGDVPLALSGHVPVKVTNENGPIQKGDFLTSSSTPGYAMKWTLLDVSEAEDFDGLKEMLAVNELRRGAILGKALDSMDDTKGKIDVLLSLQ